MDVNIASAVLYSPDQLSPLWPRESRNEVCREMEISKRETGRFLASVSMVTAHGKTLSCEPAVVGQLTVFLAGVSRFRESL